MAYGSTVPPAHQHLLTNNKNYQLKQKTEESFNNCYSDNKDNTKNERGKVDHS
jgi:hypothetical protein